MARVAARTDGNHKHIVNVLRANGAFVQSLAPVGRGCPDLLVGYGGDWWVFEVKDGAKAASGKGLSPAEIEWISKVKCNARVHVVEDAEQAVKIIKEKGL